MLKRIHHIAIICSDYQQSKQFYIEKLGLEIMAETYREERQSYKLDIALKGEYVLELFSFPETPQRLSHPEACGLRHLAFEVDNLDEVLKNLKRHSVEAEEIRLDKNTGKRFTFIFDPDQLPVELYEIGDSQSSL